MSDDTLHSPERSGFSLKPVDFDPFASVQQAEGLQRLALTSSQREVFAAVQMSPDAPAAFNLCNMLRLQGPLDLAGLRQALAQMVQRHAALRTSIAPDGEVQLIHADLNVVLPHDSLGELNEGEASKALIELAAHEASAAMDLAAAPLWRARVLSWGEQQHAIIFNAHHIISDGWSVSVLFGDWAHAYVAQVEAAAPAWPQHLPYQDFVHQQLSLQTDSQEQADKAYWLACHEQPAAPLALPLDRSRPPLKTYACGDEPWSLDSALAQSLRALSARQGCTLFVTLLASFQALVARLSGQADIVFGVPLALQTQLENAHLIADGANTVPLRQTISVDQPFVELMKATRRKLLDAHEHQHLSFGNLIRSMNLPRDFSRTPLVDVIFNLDRSQTVPDFGAVRSLGLDSAKVFSNAELTVDVVDDGQQLVIHLRYLKALFEPNTLRRWLSSWERALRCWVADPSTTPAQAFLPAGDERALLDGFNLTARTFAGLKRLEGLVAEQALRTPALPAVWCMGRTLSYAELDAWANGVAHMLQAEGVLPGDKVGLYSERDELSIAGVLGILKAGAAYVPLDFAFPDERLAYMAQDAGLRWVLGSETSLQRLDWPGVRKLDARACPPQMHAPGLALQADDPAYVIYTSGTTGKPKGVVVAHRSACNMIYSVQNRPGMRSGERHAGVAMLSFDISVMDMFLPLSVGACLIVISREDSKDGSLLAFRLEQSAATSMQAAPAVWQLLLESGWAGGAGFRSISAGEPMSIELALSLRQRCAEVWNLYGPTEATVYATAARVEDVAGGVRIGLPIANTQIHVLDERLRPVPLGAVGEICIGGDGLALGYLNQPALTAERFVPDPERPGHTMYRTGDLGRWHVNGGLECLGRNDQQIKLRGWRIELGEIESALRNQPGIRQAVVQPFEPTAGQQALRAFVVCNEADFDAPQLRIALRRQLPEPMVPAQLVRLNELPMLPSGKVNRAALGEPVPMDPSIARPAEQVLSPEERQVAEIWGRLLGVQDVRASDNFFDLGGHSMLAAKAAQMMTQALNFKVDVPRLVMESLAQISRRPAGALAGRTLERTPSARLAAWMKRWTEHDTRR